MPKGVYVKKNHVEAKWHPNPFLRDFGRYVVFFLLLAYSLPLIPYYASRFPQHPQNLGYAGNYPKYWQGEPYAPGTNQEPTRYDGYPEPELAPAPAQPHPDLTGTKHPAREAIKHYSGQNFPTKSVAETTDDEAPKPGPENISSNNIKITNDTPVGAADKSKSYTRITKSPSLSSPAPAPSHTICGRRVVTDEDALELVNSRGDADDDEDDPWKSFSFGVVSDTLNYYDPYEGREGFYDRKTNAISKIEKMMDIPDLYMDPDGKWRTSPVHQPQFSKRDWPEHIRAKAEKMMNSAKGMQEKGQHVIDNDPAYQKSLREKEEAREKELATAAKTEAVEEEENPLDLLPPTGKSKGAAAAEPNLKAYPGDTLDDITSPPPQNIQSSSNTTKVPKHPADQGQLKQPAQPAQKWPSANAATLLKNINSASRKKKRPMGNFLKQEYPPGTMITRKKKCDDAGKCVTVVQPVAVAAPVLEGKTFVGQINDGQPQIHHGIVPQPIAPTAPTIRTLKQVPAPAPTPEAIVQKVHAPQVHTPAIIEAPGQPHLSVSYVPVIRPGLVLHPEEITEEAEVEKEVVKKPCGCECSWCSCEFETCPCGDPECGKNNMGPEGCTCGAPGCKCNGGAGSSRSFSSSYSNGVKNVSRKNGPGRNTSKTSSGSLAHPRGHATPSTPAELEAFWRKRAPEEFN
ncbi:hypothetical protein C7212DRAFT_345061 [Tuber magnatum]|uniref:Uncharacterized protein n=1 Tax=Tuber magnatum TaxID=42249 RepID=A0A317SXK8_9PEZI|nr:hypothetical protein C7212DRAFT_345061 [Tuber magnatum]